MRGFLLIILVSASTAASATVEYRMRHPSSSSIPCQGRLTEWTSQGGNVHSSFESVDLTCESQGKIAWVLSAEVSCGELDIERDALKACSGPKMEAFRRFLQDGDRLHSFHLIRYVFAKDCTRLHARIRRTQAVTGRQFGSTFDEAQVACDQITVVDGTKADDGLTLLAPGRFRYATVMTTGEPGETVDELGPKVVNAPYGSNAYRLRFQEGKEIDD